MESKASMKPFLLLSSVEYTSHHKCSSIWDNVHVYIPYGRIVMCNLGCNLVAHVPGYKLHSTQWDLFLGLIFELIRIGLCHKMENADLMVYVLTTGTNDGFVKQYMKYK